MKIAIWHNLPSGGASRAMFYQTKGLLEAGHYIEVWSPEGAFNVLSEFSESLIFHFIPMALKKNEPSFIENIGAVFGKENSNIKVMKANCQQAANEINAGGFDVVIVHPCLYFAVSFVGRYLKNPAVLYLQEPFRSFYENADGIFWAAIPPISLRSSISVSYWRWFLMDTFATRHKRIQMREEQYNLTFYARLLVNSYFSAESVMRAYKRKGEVCYLGVDTDLFRPLSLVRQNVVMGLGTFMRHKSPETVIKALALLPIENRPKLIWVANSIDEQYVEEIKLLAKSVNVAWELKVAVTDVELVRLLNQARCLVYPSLLEPFGFATLEANACGLPVIGIPEGGIRETVINGQTGLWSSFQPTALANNIQNLLHDETVWSQFSKNGIKNVKDNWTWTRSVAQLEQILNETANINTNGG